MVKVWLLHFDDSDKKFRVGDAFRVSAGGKHIDILKYDEGEEK